MTTKACPGEQAYDAEIAASYEEDRRKEHIWALEQSYMARVIQRIPAGRSLLDIPVGTGRFIPEYEAQRLEVLGVDISESMLSEARSRVTGSSVRLELGDARSLSCADGSFDVVVCWRLLHLIPPESIAPVIRELGRVMRAADGRLHVQAYVRDGWHRLLSLKCALGRRIRALLGRAGDAPSRWSHIRSYAHDDDALRRTFAECGLTLVAVKVLGAYGALRVKVFVLSRAEDRGR